MYVVTLISAPGGLEPDLVQALRNAWGGGDVVWLAQGEAAEFQLDYLPDNQWDVWADLQKQRVDLVVQPAAGRRKKVLLADMDSTMIQQECIDELADAAGVGDRVKGITARAMNGELNFEEAIIERVKLLEGQPEQLIQDVLETRITLMPGGKTLLATMKANGAYTALVSGGFTSFTKAVAKQLGFDENRANTLEVKNGFLTGFVGLPILGRDAKVTALDEISQRHNLTPADVIAVGDGANDLGMLEKAGIGVALHAKPTVAEQCQIRVNCSYLTSLLYIQGYTSNSFVEF